MKVLVLYRPDSEHARAVEAFMRDFEHRHAGEHIEPLNVDSRDGIAAISLYDVMQYPAILALRDDGSVLRSWEGNNLPLMDEVAFYTFAG
jgi:hypothetical protein